MGLRRHGGWRSSPRVATRLLAIVLVPMLGVGLFAGVDGWKQWRRARAAADVELAVARVQRVVGVDLAVNRQVFLLGTVAMGARLGLPIDAMGTFIGVELRAPLRQGQRDVDRAFAAVERAGDVPGELSTVRARLRALADAAPSGVPVTDIGAVVDRSNHMAMAALEQADQLLLDADGTGELRRDHAVVRAAIEAKLALGYQTSWAGLLFEATTPAERADVLGKLRMSTTQYEYARAELDQLTRGALHRRWRALVADPAVKALATMISDLARTDVSAVPTIDAAQLGQGLGVTLGRMTALHGVARAGLHQAADEARRIHAEAVAAQRFTVGVTALLALLTLAVVALIARSIVRPIRSLASAAERAGAGHLSDVVLPEGGPPELRRVTAVLGEAIANLRSVEAQVGALAAGDLDDEVLAEPVPGRLGTLVHASVARLSRSLNEREELGRRLEHEATHDPLTGLPNRAAARDALGGALERARRAGTAVAVLFIDLDGFKQVNDTHGHAVGDLVLTTTATRLQSAVRGGDLVTRIGGDEFVVVAEQADDAVAILALGQRLIDVVSMPITVRSIATRISASVGVAFAVDGEVDPDGLLRDADLATYRAKVQGRGRVEPFDEALRREVATRFELERGLRHAIDADELELHFQPVVSTAGRTTGVEALVRWRRPGVGLVPPDQFISVAEGSDLIIDLDRWVLHEACRQLASWSSDPELGGLSMSINLSGRHLLNLTVIDDVRRTLEATGADPGRLIIEITETVILTDLVVVVDHLQQLRDLGVQIAIDDFGTGYTSLTHLRRLPVDVVKIDRSMVTADQPADAHVLKLLVDTVHALGLRLVAEGVETSAQLDRLQSLGCDRVQGFLFSRAVPAEHLRAAVRGAVRGRTPETA